MSEFSPEEKKKLGRVSVGLRLRRDIKEKAQAWAEKEQVSLNSFIQKAIQRLIRRLEKKSKDS